MSWADSLSRLTVKTMASPSVTVEPATEMVGLSLSAVPAVGVADWFVPRKMFVLLPSSLMVTVPLAAPPLVTVPVIAPVLIVKVSAPS